MQNTETQKGAMITDLVGKDTRFTRFGEALKLAGFYQKLSAGGNFTVFAPTNQAFAKLPEDKLTKMMKPDNREQLRQLVSLHVFPGKLSAEQLRKAAAIRTESGREIKIEVSDDHKDIKLANAKVLLPKEEAKNGFVYPLDTVLQPIRTAAAQV